MTEYILFLICNLVFVQLVKIAYMHKFLTKQSSKEIGIEDSLTNTKHKMLRINKERMIFSIIATIYLCGTFAGFTGSMLASTDIAIKFKQILDTAVVSLLFYSVLGSIVCGYKRIWYILGVFLIGFCSYWLMIAKMFI